jgi:hypothetical protein
MDPVPAVGRLRSERGLASIQFVLAAAMAMILVVGLVQVLAYQYARGAALAAIERGVRAATVTGAASATCMDTARASLSEVLGGEMDVAVSCRSSDDLVVAEATGTVPAWVWGGPELAFRVVTVARMEPSP